MKIKLTLLLVPAFAAICLAQEDSAHLNELSLGLGGIPALTRSDTPPLGTGSGVAFQVNYGRRFLKGRTVALYGEINALANPLRDVSSSIPTATHDFASLYITPGIRAKFLPTSRISPYVLVGGGGCSGEAVDRRTTGDVPEPQATNHRPQASGYPPPAIACMNRVSILPSDSSR